VAMQLIAWGITAVIIWLLLALRGRLARRHKSRHSTHSLAGKGS
jgi:hypothetical protein